MELAANMRLPAQVEITFKDGQVYKVTLHDCTINLDYPNPFNPYQPLRMSITGRVEKLQYELNPDI